MFETGRMTEWVRFRNQRLGPTFLCPGVPSPFTELDRFFSVQIRCDSLLEEHHDPSGQTGFVCKLVLWPFCTEPFVFPLIISSSSVGSIFYSSLCIMKLSGNQLIFNSCSNVKGVLKLNNQVKTYRYYIHLCDILYLQEKKRRYLKNGSGMSTSNQLHFSSI